MTLVSSFVDVLQQLSPTMSSPTFSSFTILLTGWVFARRRVVTRMIEAADAVGTKHHSAFHRVFSSARWSLDELGLAVFGLLGPWLDDPVFLSIDDTLARKRGLKVFGAGMHHDPLLSTRKTAVVNWGHSWVVLSVLVAFPFRPKRYYSLPILFRLYVSKASATKKRLPYRKRSELAVEMLTALCRRHENTRFHAVGDSAYGGQTVLRPLPDNCDLTSRIDMDARLYEAPPIRRPGRRGRPRRRGNRLPTPRQLLGTRAKRVQLDVYGRRDRCRIVDQVARPHAVPDRPLRIVAVEPLTGGRREQAFFSTCFQAQPEQVLIWYARRWSIEEAFHDAKTHLGFEEPQGWTPKAVKRTAPTAMLLYSLILVWFAKKGHRACDVPRRPWYRTKSCASFADMLNTLRKESLRERVSTMGLQGQGSRKILRTLFAAVQHAA